MKYQQTKLPINKYGNTIIYYDVDLAQIIAKPDYEKHVLRSNLIRFDSILEFEVYKILRSKFGRDAVHHHHSIEILPKTDFDRAIKWVVDFRVWYKNYEFFVEAKGVATDDYTLRQSLLKRFKPDIFTRVMTVKKDDLQRFAHRVSTFELWMGESDVTRY